MTSLNFKQISGKYDPDNPWFGMKTYMLEPWPEYCYITYYDFGMGTCPIKKGEKTIFGWENGYAEYEALEDGIDVKCKLLAGSRWQPPPPGYART
jgi:hypothetical protein